MAYEDTQLDALALRTLATTAAVRIFSASPSPHLSWWRRVVLSTPLSPQPRRFRHLCERFTEGEYVKYPFFKVKEGPSLRLRDDGMIEHGRYKVEQDQIFSYGEVREATDEDLLLADYEWVVDWTDGRERVLHSSRGRLLVASKGDGLRRILEDLA